jgi:hypothetical protein
MYVPQCLLAHVDYKLAMILHPDSSHPASSHSDFATLHRAYNLLSCRQSRQQYLSSGYGWSSRGDGSAPSFDDAMRAEVLRRRSGGAARYGSSYRRSDAGAGAWGGYGAGSAWKPNPEDGFPEQGKGEALYMSNERFMSIFIAIVSHGLGIDSESSCKCSCSTTVRAIGVDTMESRDVVYRYTPGAATSTARGVSLTALGAFTVDIADRAAHL